MPVKSTFSRDSKSIRNEAVQAGRTLTFWRRRPQAPKNGGGGRGGGGGGETNCQRSYPTTSPKMKLPICRDLVWTWNAFFRAKGLELGKPLEQLLRQARPQSESCLPCQTQEPPPQRTVESCDATTSLSPLRACLLDSFHSNVDRFQTGRLALVCMPITGIH